MYVTYCEHQGKLDRTLKRLKESKTTFLQTLELLESDPACCGKCNLFFALIFSSNDTEVFLNNLGLSLHSFLMLPMQRITRLPLLVDAVLSKLKSDDDEYDNWKMTLAILNKVNKTHIY